MGALQQVLLDEELARRLQEQEEEVLARVILLPQRVSSGGSVG